MRIGGRSQGHTAERDSLSWKSRPTSRRLLSPPPSSSTPGGGMALATVVLLSTECFQGMVIVEPERVEMAVGSRGDTHTHQHHTHLYSDARDYYLPKGSERHRGAETQPRETDTGDSLENPGQLSGAPRGRQKAASSGPRHRVTTTTLNIPPQPRQALIWKRSSCPVATYCQRRFVRRHEEAVLYGVRHCYLLAVLYGHVNHEGSLASNLLEGCFWYASSYRASRVRGLPVRACSRASSGPAYLYSATAVLDRSQGAI